MLVLTKEREAKKFNKSELARRAKMQGSIIGWIESGRFKPYDVQMKKIAKALDWKGDPADLFKETE